MGHAQTGRQQAGRKGWRRLALACLPAHLAVDAMQAQLVPHSGSVIHAVVAHNACTGRIEAGQQPQVKRHSGASGQVMKCML